MTQDLSGLRSPQVEETTVAAAGRRLAVRRLDPRRLDPRRPDPRRPDPRRPDPRRPDPPQPDRAPGPDGGNAAPTLVFLHEGLGSIAQWRDFPDALCRRTALPGLVYERWGFGGSEPLELPRPRDYLAQEAQLFLPAVLEACGVQRPLLVGHSDGGSIALLYAAAFPERPLACITEAAHVFVEAAALAGIRAAVEAWRQGDLKTRLAKYHGAKTEAVFLGWAQTWLRDDFRDWSMVDRLPAIACPLLVMQGADDEYGTALQIETIVGQAGGPAEPLILPDCGHAPHLEQPDAVLDAMAAFVGRVTACPVPQPS